MVVVTFVLGDAFSELLTIDWLLWKKGGKRNLQFLNNKLLHETESHATHEHINERGFAEICSNTNETVPTSSRYSTTVFTTIRFSPQPIFYTVGVDSVVCVI